ncbi:MAG TPA: acyl-CoA dehydrogenase family protein, partial [Acetobacteraceae bacterium]|nr:acyl-CoA dehydrogenase family protein [Acetobacteraceae bacterium]
MADEGRYHPSQEQLAIAGALDSALTALLPLSRLHAAAEETAEVWAELDALGVFGLCLSEARGGSGLGAAEEALIVMTLGRQLAAPGVLAAIGAVHSGMAIEGGAQRVAAAYRHGDKVVLVDEPDAQLILLRDGCGAVLHRAGPSSRPIDDRYWLGRLRGVVTLGEKLAAFTPDALLRLRLIDAAALAGIGQAAVDMAVAYAKMREQFGRPIGSFQAVKHHCANMAIAATCARDQVSFASVAVDDRRGDAALQVESALLVAGSAAIENAGKNIQIHGGMGFSDEADPHLFLKRAQLLVTIAGGMEAATARVADI